MDLVFRYNANREQVEVSPKEQQGIRSACVMPADNLSKKDFFNKILFFNFDGFYAGLDAILFLMERIYGKLTEAEVNKYTKKFNHERLK